MTTEKTHQEMCADIVAFILKNVGEDKKVSFEYDLGEGTATIIVGDEHTHVGWPDATPEELTKNLWSTVTGNGGLSWV